MTVEKEKSRDGSPTSTSITDSTVIDDIVSVDEENKNAVEITFAQNESSTKRCVRMSASSSFHDVVRLTND
ncbi:hypothetical protein KIN20_009604 [Parelaphostrongylus tenuis]|uniref:Uncharacterized protein n=1 Tax=Parelaphostrongylus tenuis TaxID=148309 RepID=A0AAD5MSS0_PARTN|nr:hypothetical protein KIN20_009604 [Parelaphostrongylus tenuis]